ncbi:hypothetical protein Tco_0493260 [Tanacetum coccineum]
MEILPESSSNKHCGSLTSAESDSLPYAHTQAIKTYYKHQDSRIRKAQELNIEDFRTMIFKIFSNDIQIIQDKDYGNDDKDKQGKDLKISELKTKSKDNDKGSRSKISLARRNSLQQDTLMLVGSATLKIVCLQVAGDFFLRDSKKQTCIISSTMKYEFVALAAVGKEAKWLKNLILEIPLWSKPIALISIRCDSVATLAKAYSPNV